MDQEALARRLLAVVTRIVTFHRADDYRAAKFGMEQAIKGATTGKAIDLTLDDEVIMRAVYDLAIAQSALMPLTRKTKAIDIASKAMARDVLADAFREELPEG